MSDSDDRAAVEAFYRALRSSPKSRAKKRRSASTDLQRLDTALQEVVQELGWQDATTSAQVLTRWADIVGPEVSDHVRAMRCVDGILEVQADATAWATQVRLLLPHLQARLDEEFGAGVVREITVLGPAAPSWVRGPRRVPGRGPRDTYG